ncbi:MAG: Mrp/NBP35 family ATP-binding protein [Actinomycetaceae bacterium]|nr:Mrp/NBP35 family ATP-binding protein [Actinomycetaceae bacterium]
MSLPQESQIREALTRVIDPEIHRPITDLDMVRSVDIAEDGTVTVGIDLTIAGCPMKSAIAQKVEEEVSKVEGVTSVEVSMGAMTPEQREALKEKLQGPQPVIPFTQPDSLTRIYAVTSGKGGVGKSSITANLAAALADEGLKVGVVDADLFGFSIPRMMGVEGEPTSIDGMILPPMSRGVKVMSIGMFVPEGQPVIWRGPMLHRAIQQFLSEVYWGDLDVLLLDLPPGTGDIAISVAQFLPNAEILVVTTPQVASAEVAERAGSIATQTDQRVIGVIENMSYIEAPDGTRMEVFGKGGGETVSTRLSTLLGYQVPLLAQIPLEVALRVGSDTGLPLTISPEGGSSVAADALRDLAGKLAKRSSSLAGLSLGVTPV